MKLTFGVLAALVLTAAPTAHAAARPDLRATVPTPATFAAAPGATVTLKTTVRNAGRGGAKRSVLRLVLSKDAKRDRKDTVLKRANVRSLKTGKRSTLRLTFKLPATPGTYRLLACADDLRKIREARESNNCATAKLTLVSESAPVPTGGSAPAPAPVPQSAPAPSACAATDVPDLAHVDSDCDGIDGTAAASVFVSPYGDDAAPGTKAAPKRTIGAGIAAAAQSGRTAVLISGGQYPGVLTIADGISLYGGYHASTWQRADNIVSWIQGGAVADGAVGARAENIGTDTTLQRLRITAPNATTGSSYGLRALQAPRLRLERIEILAGNGAKGPNGADGADGADGAPGAAGKAGACDSNIAGAGGAGGGSYGFAYGGAGGAGGTGSLQQTGKAGYPGWNAVPGGAGGATGDPGKAGQSGANGLSGSAGGAGEGGAGGAIVNGGWRGADGKEGFDGVSGQGGGGGGGGGGQDISIFYGGGNGGGGGGEGGHAGQPGKGGKGGGGSFGVFAVGSHGLVITDSTVSSSAGGNGGHGGEGGTGGLGAAGGPGGKACVDEVGAGGPGGKGGAGGKGGPGGGGAGGPSYALFGTSGQLSVSNTILTHGTAGYGGLHGGLAGTAAQRFGV